MDANMESQDQTQILVRNAQEGRRTAFEELASRHRLRLEALIHSRLGPALRETVEVEDLIQETLLRAFASIGRFKWEGDESFFRWLAGIAVRVILQEAEVFFYFVELLAEPFDFRFLLCKVQADF